MTIDKINNNKMINCTVKNCRKLIPIDDAIKINGKYYCKVCGVAKTKTLLNFFGD
jgi:hypothetical protein